MLTNAVDDELIDANPALQVGRKKRRAGLVTAADRIRAIKPMAWEQRTLLLDAAMAEPRWSAFFATLAKAGLRPGEAFALRPDDVGFREQTISVERAGSHGRIKATKTYERRTVRSLARSRPNAAPPPRLAQGGSTAMRLGRARGSLSERPRPRPGQVGRGQGLPPDAQEGEAPGVPAL